jgi:two-component system, OmpR family, phosphate regulon sensor histidine kinase PhoR
MLSPFSTKTHLTAAVLAVGLCAIGLAWVLEPAFIASSIWVRLGLLAAGFAVGLASHLLLQMQLRRDDHVGRKYVEALGRIDPSLSAPETIADSLPELPAGHPMSDGFARLRESFLMLSEKLAAAEHVRAGGEVRVRRMAAERDQFKEILAGLSDPVVAIDEHGDVILANGSAQQLLGLRIGDAEHPALEKLDRCQELISLLTETRRRKAATHRQGEVALADEDGQPSWFKISCRALAGHADGPGERTSNHGAVAVLTDISGLKAIQKRNAEFVSAVSHEMKTPLASIKAYVELLADGDAEDEATRDEFFRIINGQADRLQRLIENLLNLARIEAGVVQVNKIPLPLNPLLQEAYDVLLPAAEQKNMKLVADLSPLYLGVLADRDTLLQAAINLLSNALKYTHPGGTVTLRSRLRDQEVVFEVEDTGVGLSPEDCQKVFEKFYRVKKDKDMAAGTGLGLPLVKHIVEDVHRGRIEVDSELGKGCTFRVVVPSIAQMSS